MLFKLNKAIVILVAAVVAVVKVVSPEVIQANRRLWIEVITPVLMNPVQVGAPKYIGPAYDTALLDIGLKYPLLNFTQKIIVDTRYITCQDWETEADHAVAEYYYSVDRRPPFGPNLTVLVYPGCSEVMSLSELATEWDILMLTSVASPSVQKKCLRSPTWITTTCISRPTFITVYNNLFIKFNWSSFAIISDISSNSFFVYFARDMYNEWSTRSEYQVNFVSFDSKMEVDYEQVLRRINRTSRVYLYFGHQNQLRVLMITARILKMTNGEYVYLAMTPVRHNAVANFSWDLPDGFSEARDAFRSLIILEPDASVYGKGNGADDLLTEWKLRSQRDYNYTYGPTEEVTPHPSASYAALLILAQVVNEVYSDILIGNSSANFSKGKHIAKRFFNRTFIARTGSMSFNDVGDRVPPMIFTQLDYTSGKSEVIMIQNEQTNFKLVEVRAVKWPGAWPPPNQPRCGFRGYSMQCVAGNSYAITIIGTSVGAALLLACVALCVFTVRKKAEMSASATKWWQLDNAKLDTLQKSWTSLQLTELVIQFRKSQTTGKVGNPDINGAARYEQTNVWLKPIVTGSFAKDSMEGLAGKKDILLHLAKLRSLVDNNINPLLGLCFCKAKEQLLFVATMCPRGSVAELIHYTAVQWDLQVSLMIDLLRGMVAVHDSSIKVHGHLTSTKCLIDNHFTMKIGSLGYQFVKDSLFKRDDNRVQTNTRKHLFVAPEILRHRPPTSASDVYAVGIILNQIIVQTDPYEEYLHDMFIPLEDLLYEIAHHTEKPLRPRSSYPENLVDLKTVVANCWDSDPSARPGLKKVLRVIENITGIQSGKQQHLIELVLKRLERYTNDLDEQVDIRTAALIEERRKCDKLLNEMLPGTIVNAMRTGEVIQPEMFDSVTILFSEIGGFQSMLITTHPAIVMSFLNTVYSLFDQLIAKFDVYKVETIKDSYLVVSGLPIRNGDQHIHAICSLALDLLKTYRTSCTGSLTALRIGVHSGPCAAGVVGHKTPRYCLFGDTVNTASRMLLHGADSKIHLSTAAAALLAAFSGFFLTSRGTIAVKGRGSMVTFWLQPIEQ